MKKIRITPFSPGGGWAKKMLLTMKLTIIILFISLMQVSATVYSQATKFTFAAENKQVVDVLREIEENSQFRFFYLREQVDVERRVSVKANDATVEQILDELFKENDVNYELMNDFLIVLKKGDATLGISGSSDSFGLQQQPAVSGTVTDESGQPLPGVTVIIKGTTQGTVTNADGEYSLVNVPDDATLQFSFVGMKTQEVEVGNQSTIDVTMVVDAIGIEEVVAIGYGTMRKSDLTGSVTRANIESFEEQPNVSIAQSLQGTVPGLNVGAVNSAGESPGISIRGRNTLSGSTNPLIVLDGIIYNGSMSDLNPNDIESIDILKDASSKAIYGSQAANGVILITSTKGSEGKEPEFTYSTYYSFESPSNRLTPMDREQYIQKTKDAFYQEAYLGPDYIQENPDFDPITKMTDPNSQKGFETGADVDWLDLVTQQGHINNHNISMAGSTETLNYYLSGGYTDQKGYIKGDNYNRASLRANFDNEINSWLNVGFQSFITSADYSGRSADLRIAYLLPPVNVPYDENGEFIEYPHLSMRSPLIGLKTDNFDKRLNLFAKAYAEIDIPYVDGLSYTFNYSTNYRTSRQYGFDKYAQNNAGAGYKNNGVGQDNTIDNILSYKKIFAEDHKIDATALYGYQKRWGDGTNASAAIFSNDVLGYHSLESGDVEQRGVSSSAYDEYSLYQMGRLHYGYKSTYLITGTVRRDGFSGFGSNKKFGIFPSAALAWVASNEDFIANALPVVSLLKMRVSYGQSGNRTIGRYGTLSRVATGYVTNFEDRSAYGQWINNLGNNDLGWETTTGLNFGLDFAVYKGRINGSVDYYLDKTEDILFSVSIPQMTGFGSVLSNIGEIKNNGLEISINSVNVKAGDFSWNTTVNFSTNSNEIVSVLGKDEDGDGVEDDLIGNGLFIGEARGAIYHYVTDGIYQLDDDIPDGYRPGNYIVKDLSGEEGVPDGTINAEYDRKIIGYSEPAYRFSVYNKFSYKDLSFSFFVNSIQGGEDGYYGYTTPNSLGAWSGSNLRDVNIVNEWDYWTPDNPDARFQGLLLNGAVSPRQYDQRSFIRLQDVTLSYDLKSVAERIGLKGAKINFSGKNLLTITDWYGTDPELGLGINAGHMPLLKSYSFGLNVTF